MSPAQIAPSFFVPPFISVTHVIWAERGSERKIVDVAEAVSYLSRTSNIVCRIRGMQFRPDAKEPRTCLDTNSCAIPLYRRVSTRETERDKWRSGSIGGRRTLQTKFGYRSRPFMYANPIVPPPFWFMLLSNKIRETELGFPLNILLLIFIYLQRF